MSDLSELTEIARQVMQMMADNDKLRERIAEQDAEIARLREAIQMARELRGKPLEDWCDEVLQQSDDTEG